MQADLHIRPAERRDAGLVLELIRELAEYEKLLDQVEATEARIEEALFGASARVFCDIAELSSAPVGFALWFYNFSTFKGRHGIYLEDLYVRPAHRGLGVGRVLLERLARRCVAEGLGRLEWAVLDWNAPAIAFYERLGATAVNEWTTFRLTGPALARLGVADGQRV